MATRTLLIGLYSTSVPKLLVAIFHICNTVLCLFNALWARIDCILQIVALLRLLHDIVTMLMRQHKLRVTLEDTDLPLYFLFFISPVEQNVFVPIIFRPSEYFVTDVCVCKFLFTNKLVTDKQSPFSHDNDVVIWVSGLSHK